MYNHKNLKKIVKEALRSFFIEDSLKLSIFVGEETWSQRFPRGASVRAHDPLTNWHVANWPFGEPTLANRYMANPYMEKRRIRLLDHGSPFIFFLYEASRYLKPYP